MEGWIDGGMDGWIRAWMHGWMQAWMHGWMDGWMTMVRLRTVVTGESGSTRRETFPKITLRNKNIHVD
jgi:hypothetical protein